MAFLAALECPPLHLRFSTALAMVSLRLLGDGTARNFRPKKLRLSARPAGCPSAHRASSRSVTIWAADRAVGLRGADRIKLFESMALIALHWLLGRYGVMAADLQGPIAMSRLTASGLLPSSRPLGTYRGFEKATTACGAPRRAILATQWRICHQLADRAACTKSEGRAQYLDAGATSRLKRDQRRSKRWTEPNKP